MLFLPFSILVLDGSFSRIYLCDVSWPEVHWPSFQPLVTFPLTFATEFAIVNPHLLRDLVARKMWSSDIKQSIIAANGSVQHLQLPEDIKAVSAPPSLSLSSLFLRIESRLHLRYKTAWEIKMRSVIDMAADRCGADYGIKQQIAGLC